MECKREKIMPYSQIKNINNQVWNTDDKDFFEKSTTSISVLPVIEIGTNGRFFHYQIQPSGITTVIASFKLTQLIGVGVSERITDPLANEGEGFVEISYPIFFNDPLDPANRSSVGLANYINGQGFFIQPVFLEAEADVEVSFDINLYRPST